MYHYDLLTAQMFVVNIFEACQISLGVVQWDSEIKLGKKEMGKIEMKFVFILIRSTKGTKRHYRKFYCHFNCVIPYLAFP